ncbi:hypothetical protein [Rathayibacter toxicus]|uniref:Uncharacterized protein n=1 Tax=Rathayibacter toxicus TaxID=145458 RepID=A0A2S5Y824_9MICO|nr:hypothetical protein [Rathayibacter toxicus]PPH25328.1 hypothetical protein C5D17_01255 [Rathayibacter toxicus]PPH58573.1 hypothetical protein C5D30_01260 [Rathayibacter toxicus]PPH60565.1 hypothetical protein C5C93_01285 [Rathayibacter toxicus]PPH88385.1 hypothetical protein C5D31_01260 [Rathayibacter toxicus]PPI16078.1 hypothetical protein C5C51_01255 [Rathayibacter toxicus]
MSKTFEELVSNLFSDLVSVSLEYAGKSATDIFIYASLEEGVFFDPFFANGTEVLTRSKLSGVDTSIDRQRLLVNYGTTQLSQFVKDCANFTNPTPTEIRLHYVVATGKTDVDLEYVPQWSDTPDISFHDRSRKWQEEARVMLAQRSV